MNLLAIETSTEACSAALSIDGDIRERYEVAPRGHGQLILGMVDALMADAGLAPAQLDGIAFGRGPGAFTGVRIATAVVQGIAFGADLPVVPVSTLAALAQGAYRQGGHKSIISAIDARMDEIYWGAFIVKNGLVQSVAEECVMAPQAAPLVEGGPWFGAGSGWTSYKDSLEGRYRSIICAIDGTLLPHAADVAQLAGPLHAAGKTVSAEEAVPVYLRDDVVQKK